MWIIQHNTVDWDSPKTQTLLATLKTSKSTSGGILCIFGSRTFVLVSWMCNISLTQFYWIWSYFFRCRSSHGWLHSYFDVLHSYETTLSIGISPRLTLGELYVSSEVPHFVIIIWMCKKQPSVTHSSREAAVMSLDAGLRMDGIFPFSISGIWWLKCFILPKIDKYRRTRYTRTKKRPNRDDLRLTNVDQCHFKRKTFSCWRLALQFWRQWSGSRDINKCRIPTMRHVFRTHRVALHGLCKSN